MTDDIRERVAGALANADGWATTGSTIADYLPLADAALSACRYAEMREALDNLVMALELPGDHCEVKPAMIHARTALAKARGET